MLRISKDLSEINPAPDPNLVPHRPGRPPRKAAKRWGNFSPGGSAAEPWVDPYHDEPRGGDTMVAPTPSLFLQISIASPNGRSEGSATPISPYRPGSCAFLAELPRSGTEPRPRGSGLLQMRSQALRGHAMPVWPWLVHVRKMLWTKLT